ncbi:protein CMS1 [Syzygium oleosum]|uniref:protein CMS1 n=1 Tax=Syzygium oleosum TaxID=219896 RepID=UPI0011D26C1C|nr:protein CMS1 [Syzygium oleosum]
MGSRRSAAAGRGGGGGRHKPSRLSPQNPHSSQSNPRFKKQKQKKQRKKKKETGQDVDAHREEPMPSGENAAGQPPASASEQLGFFLAQYQSANGVHLSSLELDSIGDTCILELSQGPELDVDSPGKQIKAAFGPSWKGVLYEGTLEQGKIDPGSPAIIAITASAIRTIELLRGFRSLTRVCHPAKLFSKHIKVEEQVAMLKNRVNIACGTPNRIKKLIDIEALGLSRLSVILLDMHTDVKGYSLLTLPQVRDEFWDLYKNYFHERVVKGNLQICLFGPVNITNEIKGKSRVHDK